MSTEDDSDASSDSSEDSSSSASTADSTSTGDVSGMTLWIVLFCAAVISLFAANRKRRSARQK